MTASLRRLLRMVLGVLTLYAGSSLGAAEPDWPNWRGPHHDGISRETGLLKTWPTEGPRVLWKVPLSGGYSAVAVAKGRLYTHTARDKKEEIVLCLDAATGKELWQHRYPCDYDRYVTLRENWDRGPRATPAVDEGRVFTQGTTGIVLCLDAATGNPLWERDLLRLAGRSCPEQGYCSSPLVLGEFVYVQPGGKGASLAALDKRDGRIVWKSLDDAPSYASPLPVTFNGSTQIVWFTGEAVVGVSPREGRVLWRQPWRTEPPIHGATPIHHDGRIFISSNYGVGAALFKLRPEGDPEPVWKSRTMQNQYATCVLYQGHLYGFSGFRLRCVDLETGESRWDTSGIGKGALLVADGQLLILSERGELILAEATPKAYVEKSRHKLLGGICCTVPVLAGGRLYLRSEDMLLALDVKGEKR